MNEEQQLVLARDIHEIKQDLREVKQAVSGDPNIGLVGLVGDMREMKEFRNGLALKVAAMSGFVTAAILGGKAMLAKFFGG